MPSSDVLRNLFRIWAGTRKRTLPQSTGPKRGDFDPNDEDLSLGTPPLHPNDEDLSQLRL
jgi:hypothetical protein